MSRSALCLIALSITLSLVGTATHAAPRYDVGDYGVFGLPLTDNWAFSSFGNTLNSLDDGYSSSFTAPQNLTIDRAMQRLVGVDAGTTLRIGMQADNGSGAPSGTWITSTVFNPIDGDSTPTVNFGTVNLVAGNKYHLVTQPDTLGGGDSMVVFSGHTSNTYRPYDRSTDLAHRGNARTNGGAWVGGADPFTIYANGSDTNYVAQISQPYGHMGASATFTQGAHGSRTGTTFRISDGEVAPGQVVGIHDFTLRMSKSIVTPNLSLVVAIRQLDGTPINSVTIPMSSIPAGVINLTRQWPGGVQLIAGQDYLFTTGFSPTHPGAGASTTSDFIFLYVAYSPANGDAGWVGRIAHSGGATPDAWNSYSLTGSIGDLPVSFNGLVPEPGALGLIAVSGILMQRRRRTVQRA